MTWLLVAVLWVPLSFFLHLVIHEGAHALAVRHLGIGCQFHLWPGWLDGRWCWAWVRFDRAPPESGRLSVSLAPLVAEFLWWCVAVVAVLFLPHGWWLGVVAVEMVSSLVDATTWLLGWWNPKSNSTSDAEKVRECTGWSRGRFRLLSLLALLAYAGTGLALWRGLCG